MIGMKNADTELGVSAGDEDEGEAGYGAAKKDAANRLASALGIDSDKIDAKALCAAVKEIVELESD